MGDHRENNVQIWTKVGLVLKIDGIPFCLAADMNSSAQNSQLLLYMYLLFISYLWIHNDLTHTKGWRSAEKRNRSLRTRGRRKATYLSYGPTPHLKFETAVSIIVSALLKSTEKFTYLHCTIYPTGLYSFCSVRYKFMRNAYRNGILYTIQFSCGTYRHLLA